MYRNCQSSFRLRCDPFSYMAQLVDIKSIIPRLKFPFSSFVESAVPVLAKASHAKQSTIFALARRQEDPPLAVLKLFKKKEDYEQERKALEIVHSSLSLRLSLLLPFFSYFFLSSFLSFFLSLFLSFFLSINITFSEPKN